MPDLASRLLRRKNTTASSAERRFAQGSRSVADRIAPSAIEESRFHVAIDERLSRILALSEYPRHVSPNWLGRLIDFDEPLDLSLHLEPLESVDVIRNLTHRMVELQSSRMLDARGGRIASVEREVAYEDVERLRDALERGDERVFSTSLYLRLHGRTSRELDEATARMEGALGGMMAECRAAIFEMLPGLLSCLPAGQDHLGRRRNLAVDRGLLYGENVHNHSLVIFDPFGSDQENANKVVFAKSGAGKSYACKVEALRALLFGIEFIVIDPEDEYGRICEAVGGQMVRLSGASPHHINPFDLPAASDDERDVLSERVLVLLGLLGLMLADPGAVLTQQERGALDAAIYEAYRNAGITEDRATHGRPPPVLGDLLDVLRESDDPHGLADRLERYVDGSLGRVFSQRTSAALDRPFVVFNVRDLEEELRPIATYLIADHVWHEVKRHPRPRVLLIDEAWSLMRYPEGARFIALARPHDGDAGRTGLPRLAGGAHRPREQFGPALDAARQLDDRDGRRHLPALARGTGVPAGLQSRRGTLPRAWQPYRAARRGESARARTGDHQSRRDIRRGRAGGTQ